MRSDVAARLLVAFLVLAGGTAVGGLGWWLARAVRRVWQRAAWARWYQRARARHLTDEAGQELCAHCGNPALGYARGYSDERLCHHEDRDCYHQVTVYGSMVLAEERGLYWPAPTRWEMAHEDSGWLAQTAADLSPEALDEEVMPFASTSLAELQMRDVPERTPVSPGPGAALVVPPTAPGLAPERLCGPEQPHEKPAGTESAGSGHSDLGPRAAWVLACYEQQRREKWAYADHLLGAAVAA